MSKVSTYEVSNYAYCEQYIKAETELELVNNPGGIVRHEIDPVHNWNKVGGCMRLRLLT